MMTWQEDMTPLARRAWLDQMDARAREQDRTFRRAGRHFGVIVVAALAIWAFVAYEIVTHV